MKSTHSGTVAAQAAIASEVFDDEQAGVYLGGVSPRNLKLWRSNRGLPFLRITHKTIRYRKADLDRWLDQHRVQIGGR